MTQAGRGREGRVWGCELLAKCLRKPKLTVLFLFFFLSFFDCVLSRPRQTSVYADYYSFALVKKKKKKKRKDFWILTIKMC